MQSVFLTPCIHLAAGGVLREADSEHGCTTRVLGRRHRGTRTKDRPRDADAHTATGEAFLCPFKKTEGKKTQNQNWEPRANGLRGAIKNYFHPVFLHGLTKLMFTHLQLSKRIMCLMKEKSTDSHIYCPSLALVLNLI